MISNTINKKADVLGIAYGWLRNSRGEHRETGVTRHSIPDRPSRSKDRGSGNPTQGANQEETWMVWYRHPLGAVPFDV